jgi:myosin heavy subunit
MNIVGKILVILNLLFALVVGGFLVMDVATRTNWKREIENRDRDLRVLHTSMDTKDETINRLRNELTTARAHLKRTAQGNLDLDDKLLNAIKLKEIELGQLRHQIEEAKLTSERALAESKRYIDEIKLQRETLKNRDTEILALNEKVQESQKEQMAQKERGDALQARAASLMEDLRHARQELAKLQAKGASGSGVVPVGAGPRELYQPNPPQPKVVGKIERIDTENGFVEVNVGLDDGVDKNHTLEVYRTSPKAEYLGMILILNADAHTARGRLLRSPYAPAPKALKQGDTVADSLK